jgi:TATA-binding protein-associated factor Taf7
MKNAVDGDIVYRAEWVAEILLDECGGSHEAVYSHWHFSNKKEAAKFAQDMAEECGESPEWHRVHALRFNQKHNDWDNTGTFFEDGEFVPNEY